MPLSCPSPVPLTPKMVANTVVLWPGILMEHVSHTHTHTCILTWQDLVELLFCFSYTTFWKIMKVQAPLKVFWLLFIIISKGTQFPLPFGVKVFRRKQYFLLQLSGDVQVSKCKAGTSLAGRVLPLGNSERMRKTTFILDKIFQNNT